MITVRELSARWKGHDEYLSDGGARNGGRLVARKRRRHTAFLFRYFDDSGRKRWLPLGQYDEKGIKGLSLPQAREAAAKYSGLYVSGIRNLHQYVREQLAKDEAARKVEDEAAPLAAEEALDERGYYAAGVRTAARLLIDVASRAFVSAALPSEVSCLPDVKTNSSNARCSCRPSQL